MTTIYVKDNTKLPNRADSDLYATPMKLVNATLLNLIPLDVTRIRKILDIGAGDGRWGTVAKNICFNADTLVGVGIRPTEKPEGFTEWYVADFLKWESNHKFDLIVSNPPYFAAEKIIRRAWDMLVDGGIMIMLLRLSFQAGIGRYKGLWQEMPPRLVGVCPRRPSFYGTGTNGTDYGVYQWMMLVA